MMGDVEGNPIDIKISKKSQTYYCIISIQSEVVLVIVSPPTFYGSVTDVAPSAKLDYLEGITGELDVKYDNSIKYDKPIILFNEKNTAGLTLQGLLPNIISTLKENDAQQKYFKTEFSALSNSKAHSISNEGTISIANTTLDISSTEVHIRPSVFMMKKESPNLKILLQCLTDTLFKVKDGTFRSNIMLYNPNKKVLQVVASYGMDGYRDERIEIPLGWGGAGSAFIKNNIEILDLELKKHEDYGIDSRKIWEDMKSLISVPIIDTDELVIGVLNIDSDQFYKGANFHNSELHKHLRLYSKVIGTLISEIVDSKMIEIPESK